MSLPYPGTPIYSLYEKKVVETKYEKFNQYNLIYKHENLDNLKITKLKNFAYRKFYLRPSKFKIIAKSLLVSNLAISFMIRFLDLSIAIVTFKLYIRLIKYLLFRNSDIIHLRVENEKMEIK